MLTDDIAVDWVSGKLYWTDAGWARVEAMDMESLIRVELIRTGINTVPRAIALDPIRRYKRVSCLNQYQSDGLFLCVELCIGQTGAEQQRSSQPQWTVQREETLSSLISQSPMVSR